MWEVKYRFVPRHRYNIVRTGLKPGYYCIDTLMLHANMSLLREFVEIKHEEEQALKEFTKQLIDNPDPNAPKGFDQPQINTQTEALIIYRWWVHEWQDGWDDYEAKLHSLYGKDQSKPLCTKEELWELENSLYDKEQEMLKRLIEIRLHL